jgi:hypothetical protein
MRNPTVQNHTIHSPSIRELRHATAPTVEVVADICTHFEWQHSVGFIMKMVGASSLPIPRVNIILVDNPLNSFA